MGAWGAGLYQCDAAADLKDAIARVVRLPLSPGELAAILIDRNPAALDPADEDHSIFWLVLADQFHRFGIEERSALNRAVTIIDDGRDDAIMAELEMGEKDRAKRRMVLAALKGKWSAANSKRAKRHILKAPEPFVVGVGEIWTFPAQDGNPPNTYMPGAWIDRNFQPNGWAAFAVAANRHQLGWFAVSFVMRLHVDGSTRPDLDTCLAAPISGARYTLHGEKWPLDHVAGWVEVTRTGLRKMRAERIGAAGIDEEAVRRSVAGFELDAFAEPGSLAGRMNCWQREIGSARWQRYAAPLDIRLADLLLPKAVG
ncbi:MAG: hypothetical protein RLZ98_1981 [Pseudomonadota bacterium]|jgi:hypothetical protein